MRRTAAAAAHHRYCRLRPTRCCRHRLGHPGTHRRGDGAHRGADDECGRGDPHAEQPGHECLPDTQTAQPGDSPGGSAAAPPPAPAAKATPAPEFPRGYTLLSQTCTL
ncbi:hypothetical protein [Micromonospora sp. NPDC006431]|uniref:hypothetical protein n=1 Tax=Micromonospora sp. NPDC006431 TaxID=3364235 RepID=UPI0036A90459